MLAKWHLCTCAGSSPCAGSGKAGGKLAGSQSWHASAAICHPALPCPALLEPALTILLNTNNPLQVIERVKAGGMQEAFLWRASRFHDKVGKVLGWRGSLCWTAVRLSVSEASERPCACQLGAGLTARPVCVARPGLQPGGQKAAASR